MTSRGRRILLALVCVVALSSVAAPVATSSPSRHHSTLAALESGVLQQLNAIRARHGLVALRANSRLAAAAAQHSREMAADGYFAHNSANGTPFFDRIAQWYTSKGYGFWSVGENLLWSSPDVDSGRALTMWMNSPEHRANILNGAWREIGVAAVHTVAGGAYGGLPVTIITTDFGVRR